MLRSRDMPTALLGVNPLRATANARNFFSTDRIQYADLVQVVLVTQQQRESFLPHTTIDALEAFFQPIYESGVRAIKLFTEGVAKDLLAEEATSSTNLTVRSLQILKAQFPDVYVMTENCLCPYTSHGSCAIHDHNGRVDKKSTEAQFVKSALLHAEHGADAVGPAAMAEGLTGAVRSALNSAGYSHVSVIPHLIFRSSVYRSYRSLMQTGDGEHRPAFQIDKDDARGILKAALQFVDEGATGLLMEPALHLNDILWRVQSSINIPIGAFSSSGEYKMIVIDTRETFPGREPLIEFANGLKRSGAHFIASYAAKEMADIIAQNDTRL